MKLKLAPPSKSKNLGASRWAGVLYVLPSFTILMLIAIIPILWSAFLSFTAYDVLSSPRFIGLDNYRHLFTDPNFKKALIATVVFTVISVPLQIFLAMIIGEVLARTEHKRLASFTRSVLFVPVVASLILVGTVWQYMLSSDSGFFNQMLKVVGLSTVNFLGRPWLALISVAMVSVWKNVGYFLVLFYAGILDIPRERYEAARVDGCAGVQQWWHITVPGLRPVTLLCVVLATIWSFQVFDLVYSMTGGGPGGATTTLVMAIYSAGFKQFQMGYASAMAMALLLIVVVVSALQRIVMRNED